MPKRPCIETLCPEWAQERGRCRTHARERNRATHTPVRTGQAKRGGRIYGSKKWRVLRLRKLAASPICEECGQELATEVDHIVPIEDGGAPFKWSNLQSLDARCHGRKTAGEVRAREYS